MTATTLALACPEPEFLRVKEALAVLRISRTTLYAEIRAQRLATVKRGRSRLISPTACREYAALLKKEAEADK